VTKLAKKEKWRLVRGTNLPARLRHTLYVLMLAQGDNGTLWYKRATLADELGIQVGTLSNQLKELERLEAIQRLWKSRGGRPSREYAIRFDMLATMQRPPSRHSEGTPSRENEGTPSTFTESGRSPSRENEGHLHADVRHEHTEEHTEEHTLSNGKRANLKSWIEYGTNYATGKNLNTSADRLEDSFDHYEANGWKQKSGQRIKDWKAACRSSVRNHHRWNGTADTSDEYATVRQKIVSTYQTDLKNIADVEAVLTPEQFAAAKPIIRQIATSHPYDKATAEAYRTARKATA
jgi:hypothetical protein